MTTITISLPDSLKAFIDSQVASKGYGNVSEYVRSLLPEALAKAEDVRLEALLLKGLASSLIPLDADFRNRLEAKVEQVLDKYKDRARPCTCSFSRGVVRGIRVDYDIARRKTASTTVNISLGMPLADTRYSAIESENCLARLLRFRRLLKRVSSSASAPVACLMASSRLITAQLNIS